jgi:hypothetical protein
MVKNARQEFDGLGTPDQAQSDLPLVNFMWINRKKALTDFADPVCAVELANIKRALENANQYPEADFNIWVDKKLLDDYSLMALECFIDEFAGNGNVKLRDLQEITDYKNDDHFKPRYVSAHFNEVSERNIYSRADYARILVLDHCMETEPRRNRIIYSDIDCPDVRLDKTLPVIMNFGVVVGDISDGILSHGYIGLATDEPDIRSQLKVLKLKAAAKAHGYHLGHMAVRDFLESLSMPFDRWYKKIAVSGLLPPVGTDPDHLSYTPPAEKLQGWKAAHQLN